MPVTVEARSFQASSPTRLIDGRYFIGGFYGTSGRTYDVSPDGRRFLMIKDPPAETATLPHFVVALNWIEG